MSDRIVQRPELGLPDGYVPPSAALSAPAIGRTTVTLFLVSCDENTVIDVEVTPAELEFLKRVAAATRAESKFDCMPRMAVGTDELVIAEFR